MGSGESNDVEDNGEEINGDVNGEVLIDVEVIGIVYKRSVSVFSIVSDKSVKW